MDNSSNSNTNTPLEKGWKFTPPVLILICLGIVIIVLFLVLIWQLTKTPPSPPPLPTPPETTEEILKPGEIGELPEGEEPQTPPGTAKLPPVVFNATGKIIEVKEDRITVAGSGSNFADKKGRVLTVIFVSSTIVFEPGQKIKYQGLDGLNYLKPEMKILIGAAENVRGKTEFFAKTINILEL